MVIATLLSMLYDNDLATLDQAEQMEEEKADKQTVNYINGEFKIILRLVRVLKYGLATKKYCDMCIDLCYHMQNLRQDIVEVVSKSKMAPDPHHREAAYERAIDYLKRYYMLICFTAYLHDRKEQHLTQGVQPWSQTFTEWMKKHPELYSLLDSIDLE